VSAYVVLYQYNVDPTGPTYALVIQGNSFDEMECYQFNVKGALPSDWTAFVKNNCYFVPSNFRNSQGQTQPTQYVSFRYYQPLSNRFVYLGMETYAQDGSAGNNTNAGMSATIYGEVFMTTFNLQDLSTAAEINSETVMPDQSNALNYFNHGSYLELGEGQAMLPPLTTTTITQLYN